MEGTAGALPWATSILLSRNFSLGSCQVLESPPNTSLIFVNIHEQEKVPKISLVKSFVVLAQEANIEAKDFQVLGEELSGTYRVKFLGDYKTASSRATHFLLSLQTGGGTFKEQTCLNASGDSKRYFCNPDKKRSSG